jgi:hypothetical protein
MKTTRFLNLDCIELANDTLSLLVTQSVGPRVISLRYQGGDNLFAELPDFNIETPAGFYHFYGGHRLWRAPEDIQTTYYLDNLPVDISPAKNSLIATQPETGTGLKKSIHLTLGASRPRVQLIHTFTNIGEYPMTLAPWAITQLKPGGISILPHSTNDTGLLPNRQFALWPYTDIRSPHIHWGNRYTLIHANMIGGALKIGFPNVRGWLAYWQAGTLYVKKARFDPHAAFYDYGSSSECYCNNQFLELETLSPIHTLAPGESTAHVETWEIFGDVEEPVNEASVEKIIERLGLDMKLESNMEVDKGTVSLYT